jgi:cytochrome c1
MITPRVLHPWPRVVISDVVAGIVAGVFVIGVGSGVGGCADRTREAAIARMQVVVSEQERADAVCEARVASEPSPSAVAAGCIAEREARAERYQGLLTMVPTPEAHEHLPVFPPLPPGVREAPADDDGKRLFATLKCSGCHTVDGTPLAGSSMKGLYGSTVVHTDGSTAVVDDAYLREAMLTPDARVTKGFTPVMPSYAQTTNAATIDVLIAYIKSLQHEPAPTRGSSPR